MSPKEFPQYMHNGILTSCALSLNLLMLSFTIPLNMASTSRTSLSGATSLSSNVNSSYKRKCVN